MAIKKHEGQYAVLIPAFGALELVLKMDNHQVAVFNQILNKNKINATVTPAHIVVGSNSNLSDMFNYNWQNDLSLTAIQVLWRNQISTVGDLTSKSYWDVRKLPGMTDKVLYHINETLAVCGKSFSNSLINN